MESMKQLLVFTPGQTDNKIYLFMNKIYLRILFGLLFFILNPNLSLAKTEKGDAIQWSFDKENGVLTLSGKGDMPDYSSSTTTPCSNYALKIKRIVICEGITSIGAHAFDGCKNAISISIPSTLSRIGKYAFDGCTRLSGVYITDLAAWCRIDMHSYPLQ